jgi:hypothetical protein
MVVTRKFPDNWASDSLTEYIDTAINNIAATHANDKNEYPLIKEIDSIYLEIAQGLNNPGGRVVESILLLRSHAAFRAAAMLAMCGMGPETFVQLRSCLENALYSLHIHKNSGYDEIWLNRHTDDKSLKEVKNKFKMGDVKNTLKETDKTNYKVASILYDRTIDFGAHPNEMASTSSLTIEKENGDTKLQQIYLSGGNMQQRHAMKTTAQTGVCSLYILREIFKDRFDILGLTARLDKLRSVL